MVMRQSRNLGAGFVVDRLFEDGFFRHQLLLGTRLTLCLLKIS